MKISERIWFYVSVISFPLFFVLHGVNEQFGLIQNATIARLLLYYLLVAVALSFVAKLIFKDYPRATVFVFLILCIFFFFGAAKDLMQETWLSGYLDRYRIALPIVFILIVLIFYFTKKTSRRLVRAAVFIRTFLIICLALETGILMYNALTEKGRQKDLGDIDHELISNFKIADSVQKPFIFWVVMDEYSGNSALKKRWNFDNPLDSLLRIRGFFSADSARSPYNYTHYSLAATLDMKYLKELKEHSVIGFRDIVRGNISLYETNVVKLLETVGYKIHNYTIYNIEGHPTKAQEYFVNADFKLIDNQTLPGRIGQDIGWNLRKNDIAAGLKKEAERRLALVDEGLKAAKKSCH